MALNMWFIYLQIRFFTSIFRIKWITEVHTMPPKQMTVGKPIMMVEEELRIHGNKRFWNKNPADAPRSSRVSCRKRLKAAVFTFLNTK